MTSFFITLCVTASSSFHRASFLFSTLHSPFFLPSSFACCSAFRQQQQPTRASYSLALALASRPATAKGAAESIVQSFMHTRSISTFKTRLLLRARSIRCRIRLQPLRQLTHTPRPWHISKQCCSTATACNLSTCTLLSLLQCRRSNSRCCHRSKNSYSSRSSRLLCQLTCSRKLPPLFISTHKQNLI